MVDIRVKVKVVKVAKLANVCTTGNPDTSSEQCQTKFNLVLCGTQNSNISFIPDEIRSDTSIHTIHDKMVPIRG